MNIDFYYSKEQDNLIEVLNSNVDININGYEKLEPNTTEAAQEKHIPVARIEDDDILYIQVGEVAHPMTEEHLISAIYVVTDSKEVHKKVLSKDDMPEYVVDVANAKKIDIYAYCNLHGIWKTTIEK